MVSGDFSAAYDCTRRFQQGKALVEWLSEKPKGNRVMIASATWKVNATAERGLPVLES